MRSGEHALYGRGPECARIDRIIGDLESRRGTSLVLTGETGIGKTALLRYAPRRGHGEPARRRDRRAIRAAAALGVRRAVEPLRELREASDRDPVAEIDAAPRRLSGGQRTRVAPGHGPDRGTGSRARGYGRVARPYPRSENGGMRRPGRVRVARVYDPPGPDDGARVLVDRLWPRGLAKEAAALDDWCRPVAPSNELRRWYGHDPERFEEFAARYRAELGAADRAEALATLRERAAHGRLTLLTATRELAISHATVLARVLSAEG